MTVPLRLRLRGTPWRPTIAVGALALAVSLSMSQYLNRDLLGEIGDAARLLERQQAVATAHEAAAAAWLARARAASDREAAEADATLVQRLASLDRELAASPGAVPHPAWRDLTAFLRGVRSDATPLRPAEVIDGSERFLRLGSALRAQGESERLAHQAAMVRFRTRTVALTYLMCLLFTLTAAAATHGVLLARREVRTREEADAARREAVAAGERAQAAGRDKSRFLGMLSHELLTPLQSIISSMDIIESRGRVEAGEPLFLRLREGTRSLRARLGDLVDFAKMAAGSLAISPRRFRLDRLVEEVIADHEEAVVRKDLDIHWEPGADVRQAIVTDPRRVRQILDNLVSNAIKYTERGGVTVQALFEPAAGRLALEVRDTGIGLAPDDVARIFDPFYRVPASAAMADGSGLGLAVVRSLVDLLHGQIHVESTPGAGTCVTVWLPVAAAAGADAVVPVPSGLPQVLVVDDAHDVRAAVADVLRGLGYAPSEAGSGHEALRALADRAFAAVLLDLDLPDIPGHEVARRVRAGDGPNRATRVVLLSAADQAPPESEPWFDARVDKPVSARQLQRVLAPAGVSA